MRSLLGVLPRTLYELQQYRWGNVSLQRWLTWLLAFLALLGLLNILPGGRPLAATLALVAVVLVLGRLWAERQSYVFFRLTPNTIALGDQPPLWPADAVLLRASGLFEVAGKEARLTEVLAYYRTFETREHAVMARQTPSYFLRFGSIPSEQLGMWYIFIRPEAIKKIQTGCLYFGHFPRPALRLEYTRINAKGKPDRERVFLSFDADSDRDRVYADLTLDSGGPAHRPWRPPL